MSVKLARTGAAAYVALAIRLAEASGPALPADGSVALWQEAWRVAGLVESPLDAGRARVELGVMALRSGNVEQVRTWLGRGGEGWVDGSLCAYAAAADALDGQVGVAQARLDEARKICAAQNEWKQTLMARALDSGQAAVVLTSSRDACAGLDALRNWAADSREERQLGAAWVLAEWLARRERSGPSAVQERAAGLLLETLEALQVHERAEIVARAAGALVACGQGERIDDLLDAWLGEKAERSAPLDNFRLLTRGAQIGSALSDRARASGLLALARERAERGQTGDEKAPWALLGEAARACGVDAAQVESLWLDGLDRAVARPGYHRRVAVALTLGGMAAVGGAQAERDATRAIARARRSAGLE